MLQVGDFHFHVRRKFYREIEREAITSSSVFSNTLYHPAGLSDMQTEALRIQVMAAFMVAL